MLAKAKLVEVDGSTRKETGYEVEVQFNPQTLSVAYASHNAGGDQPGGSTTQFVGSSNSTLGLELLFDTTTDGEDVRKKTKQVAYFVVPRRAPNDKNNRVLPTVRFEWGSFAFMGVVSSMNETLDYFSEEGVPLRATLSFSLAHNDIDLLIEDLNRAGAGFGFGAGISAGISAGVGVSAGISAGFSAGVGASAGFGVGGGVGASAGFGVGGGIGASGGIGGGFEAGASFEASAELGVGVITPLSPALPGESVQQLAARAGKSADWKAIAAANGIDDPLRLEAGAYLNLDVEAS
ncbi:MAG: hypothetical protein KC425_06120 [Anaerolineales bacterium]|nr:hypothetical protein [Anaerolineales bacterium]